MTVLQSDNIWTHLQHGFRKNHSCKTHLMVTLREFYKSRETKTQTDVGILDFSRSFATVPHERLLGKLAYNSIEWTNQWIRAFLSNRTRYASGNRQCNLKFSISRTRSTSWYSARPFTVSDILMTCQKSYLRRLSSDYVRITVLFTHTFLVQRD